MYVYIECVSQAEPKKEHWRRKCYYMTIMGMFEDMRLSGGIPDAWLLRGLQLTKKHVPFIAWICGSVVSCLQITWKGAAE